MSKNAGWMCFDEKLLDTEQFWVSLGGYFFPSSRKMSFWAGGYVYMLGYSEFFLPFDGEAELSPTYEPILDDMSCWESFNMMTI